MTTIIDGYEVEPYAASEVKIGWTILIRDRGLFAVLDYETKPPRIEGQDPLRVIRVDRPPFRLADEAGMTVYKVIRKAPSDE